MTSTTGGRYASPSSPITPRSARATTTSRRRSDTAAEPATRRWRSSRIPTASGSTCRRWISPIAGPARSLPPSGAELLTLLASAALRAGDPEVHDRFAAAIHAAVELGDPRALAHALLARSRGAATTAGTVDVERVRLLRQVLDDLPTTDDPLRAKLLADLAIEIQYTGDAESMFTLGDQALAMARRLGDDETLAFVLTQRDRCDPVRRTARRAARRPGRADPLEPGDR